MSKPLSLRLAAILATAIALSSCSDNIIEKRSNEKKNAPAQSEPGARSTSSDQEVQRGEEQDRGEEQQLIDSLALVRAMSEVTTPDLDAEALPASEEETKGLFANYWQKILKEFDANANGRIDPGAEMRSLKAHLRDKLREKALMRFDSNNDGQLDEEERAAMREQLRSKMKKRRAKALAKGLARRKEAQQEFCQRIAEKAAELGEKLAERPILQGAIKRCERLQDEEEASDDEE